MKRNTTDIVDIKRGESPIQKIFRETTLVWEKTSPTPTFEPFIYSGGFYTTGSDILTFSKIDTNGNSITSVDVNGKSTGGLKVDSFMNIYLMAHKENDVVDIIKYDKDLNLLWKVELPQQNTISSLDMNISVNNNGNREIAFVILRSNGVNVGLIDNDGTQIWQNTFGSSINDVGFGKFDCAFDADGDIIIGVPGPSSRSEAGVSKISKVDGSRLWKFNPTSTNFESSNRITTSKDNNDVFVNASQMGQFRLSGSDGSILWSTTNLVFNQSAAAHLQVFGNELFYFGLVSNSQGITRKVNTSDGSLIWEYSVPSWTTFPRAYSILIDDDNFYLSVQNPNVIRKFRQSDGVLLWTLTRGSDSTKVFNSSMALYPEPLNF